MRHKLQDSRCDFPPEIQQDACGQHRTRFVIVSTASTSGIGRRQKSPRDLLQSYDLL